MLGVSVLGVSFMFVFLLLCMGGRLEGWVKCGHGVFFDRLPHFLCHGLVAVQQGEKPYAAGPQSQEPHVVLSVGAEHSCCPFVVGLSVSIITIPRPDLMSSRCGDFLRFQGTRRLLTAPFGQHTYYTMLATLLQARLATFFNFFSSTLASCLHSTTCVAEKVMGAYP